MSTKLTLVAPSDLSVGSLSTDIGSDRTQRILVTPMHRELVASGISPGVHTAVIEPLGLRPRTFLFTVAEGRDNRVELPPLSFLASGPQKIGAELLEALSSDPQSTQPAQSAGHATSGSERPPGAGPAQVSVTTSQVAPGELALSVGLSEDHHPTRTGGWRPYRLADRVEVELVDGRLEVLVPSIDQAPNPRAGGRLRVEMVLEGVRVERAMVPLFMGGTRIILQGSALSPQDTGMLIVAVDPLRRALLQALRAGIEEEAQTIAGEYASMIADLRDHPSQGDPWTVIVAALLAVRFPASFPHEKFGLRDPFADQYPWIADVHILRARDVLLAAGASMRARNEAAQLAIEQFRQARRAGAPYFAYSNQLALELLGALSEVEFPDETSNLVQWMRTRWASDEPRQRKAGTSFSWTSEQRRSARPRQLSAAQLSGTKSIDQSIDGPTEAMLQRSSLNPRYVARVFVGQLAAGLISPTAPSPKKARPVGLGEPTDLPRASAQQTKSGSKSATPVEAGRVRKPRTKGTAPITRRRPKSANDPPGLGRRITDPEDPQNRRFGERTEVGGFKLDASFDWTEGDRWVRITLQVAAIAGQPSSFDRIVEFFLHDTFQPNRVRAVFRGDGASISVQAWGGFTVGAWLPEERIELELNLAEAPGAPPPVRLY